MSKKNISLILLVALVIAGALQYKKIKSQESSMPSLIEQGDIIVKNTYAFATAASAKTAAAFMDIENISPINDRLIAVQSDVSKITEIHENLIDPDNGRMMMRKIKALDIPKEDSVTLEPKGYHVMFIDLNAPLQIDSNFSLTLIFENAGEQIIDVKVVAPGITPHSAH